MPRPHRVEYEGAIYHVTAQANRYEPLFLREDDFRIFHIYLAFTAGFHDWQIHAWCYMTTHYHLLLTTPKPNLARGMHRLNSRYAHRFNDVHSEVGHVFRRRYTPTLVETDPHLLECYRYVARNPVRAGMCARPEDWRWSSYAWLFGSGRRADLPSDELHLFRHFGAGADAQRRLQRFVEASDVAFADAAGAWHRAGPQRARP